MDCELEKNGECQKIDLCISDPQTLIFASFKSDRHKHLQFFLPAIEDLAASVSGHSDCRMIIQRVQVQVCKL